MAEYKRLDEMDVKGKRVLVRVDYNVKFKKDGSVKDDTRIRGSLDTLEYIHNNGGITIIAAHLGRPDGKVVEKERLKQAIPAIESLLASEKSINVKVKPAPDCVGEEVAEIVDNAEEGDIILLENLRFHAEEEENNPDFAKALADLCDIYVLDGFGVSHRAHASTAGVPLYMHEQGKGDDVAVGFLMDYELKLWSEARNKKGYKLLVVGGAKLEEKTKAASKLCKVVDKVLAGGAVYNVIMAAKGVNVGASLVTDGDENYVSQGKEILEKAKNLLLPTQVIIAKKTNSGYEDIRRIKAADGVPDGYMITGVILDDSIKAEIKKAQVVIYFGNIDMSDVEVNGAYPFSEGTMQLVSSISPDAYVVVGGGDSVEATKGIKNRVISTGGGASIALYSKGTLDALEALKGNKDYFKKG